MTKQEFLELITHTEIDNEKALKLEKVYCTTFPDYIKRIVSISGDSIFIDEERRMLSFSELHTCSEEYGVDFVSKSMIPIIDCYDNNFIVFHLLTSLWSKFNIVDEVDFGEQAIGLESIL